MAREVELLDLISRHSGSLRRLVLDQIDAYDGTWASVLDALKSLGNLTQLGIRKGRHQMLLLLDKQMAQYVLRGGLNP